MKKGAFRHSKRTRALLLTLLFCSVLNCHAATPIWHCSRSGAKVAAAADDFSLASLIIDQEVIRVTLKDLHSVYRGSEVSMSGRSLSACAINQDPVTDSAMESLGISPKSPQLLSRSTHLANAHIYIVNSEQAMKDCISLHHPAIGYLEHVTETEAIGPCF